jgi:hypothetical protein
MEKTMETNFKDYDTRASWIPQQNQPYEGGVAMPQGARQQLARPQTQGMPQRVMGLAQKPKLPEKMPKARALALANTFKRWIVVASIVGFGTFGGLVTLHQVGSTATQTSSTTSSSTQSSGSFLQQQGSNNIGTSSSSSTAVSGTHTS